MSTLTVIASLAGLAGCGGSGGGSASGSTSNNSSTGGSNSGSSTFTVGGMITGLGAAAGLVLVDGSDTLSVPAGATSFTMPTSVGNGQTYDVAVKVHPTALDCSVASGAGTVNGANVTTVSVTCEAGTESVLHSFAGGPADGDTPAGSLIQTSDGNLYGVTSSGGASNHGVVFKITPGGTESVLYSFAGGTADGAQPHGLYGVTPYGGASNDGVVYRLTLSGTETVLYSFAGGTTDGASGEDGLVQASDGTLYGVTYSGGASGKGTVFEIN